ncbi:unnamed protein product [Mytilus edulis]|uniref:Short-chain collagen C4-like n=1 Tax=Mytilus edulis TaxID=6550 RepID=A0A8S3UIL8_MYTED|nr:unnamed protein product [Mytilus edulis]
MLKFFILVLGILFVNGNDNIDKQSSKRLLLNDPDVIGNRLAHLESTLQTVTRSLTDLETRYSHQEGVISGLQKELEVERTKSQIHGSTYIRWGRGDCSGTNTNLVYSGYAVGEKYIYSGSYKGGASNMLCLPTDPELSNNTASSSDSYMYGTEYEDSHFGASVNEDVTCALCRSANTSSSVMFPSRKTCYSGWKFEYGGIIVSSAYSYNPSPYICVDSNPSFVTGGKRSNDDHLLYITKMRCGSLPCPPYVDNVQVYCVICSK